MSDALFSLAKLPEFADCALALSSASKEAMAVAEVCVHSNGWFATSPRNYGTLLVGSDGDPFISSEDDISGMMGFPTLVLPLETLEFCPWIAMRNVVSVRSKTDHVTGKIIDIRKSIRQYPHRNGGKVLWDVILSDDCQRDWVPMEQLELDLKAIRDGRVGGANIVPLKGGKE